MSFLVVMIVNIKLEIHSFTVLFLLANFMSVH